MTRRGKGEGGEEKSDKEEEEHKKDFFPRPIFFSIESLSRRGFLKQILETEIWNYSLIISLGIDEVRLVHN